MIQQYGNRGHWFNNKNNSIDKILDLILILAVSCSILFCKYYQGAVKLNSYTVNSV